MKKHSFRKSDKEDVIQLTLLLFMNHLANKLIGKEEEEEQILEKVSKADFFLRI